MPSCTRALRNHLGYIALLRTCFVLPFTTVFPYRCASYITRNSLMDGVVEPAREKLQQWPPCVGLHRRLPVGLFARWQCALCPIKASNLDPSTFT